MILYLDYVFGNIVRDITPLQKLTDAMIGQNSTIIRLEDT